MINLPPSTKFKKNKAIIEKRIGRQNFLLDPISGNIHTLNETANFIWRLAVKNYNLDEISKEIVENYEVGLNQAQKDAKGFLEKYIRDGLLDIVKPSGKKIPPREKS